MAARAASHDSIGSRSLERSGNGSVPGKTVVAGGSALASHIPEVRCLRCRPQSADAASNVGTGSYLNPKTAESAVATFIPERCDADPAAISGCCSLVEHLRSEW